MGKAEIITAIGEGKYTIKLFLDRRNLEYELAVLEIRISAIEERLGFLEVGTKEYEATRIYYTSLIKRKKYLETLIETIAADQTLDVWCADYTLDLTGNVGTLEIPGERQSINIRPGFDGGAAYESNRDGIIQPAICATPAAAFYNLAMQPGWQKWKPLTRLCTITYLDFDSDKCTINLDNVSHGQSGLRINQDDNLYEVPIEYMECNSLAFKVGDRAIVSFEGQDWSNPKVIGFASEPQPCTLEYLYILIKKTTSPNTERCLIWDIVNGMVATSIPLDGGGFASFPCDPDDISQWLNDASSVGGDLYSYKEETEDGAELIDNVIPYCLVYTTCPGSDSCEDTDSWTPGIVDINGNSLTDTWRIAKTITKSENGAGDPCDEETTFLMEFTLNGGIYGQLQDQHYGFVFTPKNMTDPVLTSLRTKIKMRHQAVYSVNYLGTDEYLTEYDRELSVKYEMWTPLGKIFESEYIVVEESQHDGSAQGQDPAVGWGHSNCVGGYSDVQYLVDSAETQYTEFPMTEVPGTYENVGLKYSRDFIYSEYSICQIAILGRVLMDRSFPAAYRPNSFHPVSTYGVCYVAVEDADCNDPPYTPNFQSRQWDILAQADPVKDMETTNPTTLSRSATLESALETLMEAYQEALGMESDEIDGWQMITKIYQAA